MKIAWIYPHKERCGIALYSERYLAALNRRVETRSFDPRDLFYHAEDLIAQINQCDIVHIQYETSFFMKGRVDFYPAILKKIKRPVVVSLHEVYESFPDVFPRNDLRGSGITLLLKRALYDYRHPVQTACRRHVADGFSAGSILVHQQFQKEILIKQGVIAGSITVLPHPVNIISTEARFPPWDPAGAKPAHLAACGYINPHYDYDLLFDALGRLTIPWQFTWIGGLKRDEDAALLGKIKSTIAANSWQDRFFITGWLPGEEHDAILSSADIFCAFFSSRSSSGSLAAAIGAMKPIVAASLPLTRELASCYGILSCVEHSGDAAAQGILTLLADSAVRGTLERCVDDFRKLYCFDSLADTLIDCYKKWQ